MKKILATIVLLGLLFNVQAQSKSENKYLVKRAEKFTKELVDYIADITTEQKKMLFDANYNITLQFDSIKKARLETQDYKDASKQIFKNRDAMMKKILNITQYDDYIMYRDEKKQEYFAKKKLTDSLQKAGVK
jgi:hypothetical protein